jgi:hypothetical protein
MYLQRDPLENPLRYRRIETGRERSSKPYLNSQLGFMDNLELQFGNQSVTTWTRTQSDIPEPLLTLVVWSGSQCNLVSDTSLGLDILSGNSIAWSLIKLMT